jgi:hypothetical protein
VTWTDRPTRLVTSGPLSSGNDAHDPAGTLKGAAQFGNPGVEGEDASHAFDVHADVGQLGDTAQLVNVGLAVATRPAVGAGGLDQPPAFVEPQRLRWSPASPAATDMTYTPA